MSEKDLSFGFKPARLRSERERLGFKVNEFAELVGTTRQTQTKYEKLERKPDLDYLAKAAELGIDTYYVITGKRSHLDSNQEINENENLHEISEPYIKLDQNNKAGSPDPTFNKEVGSETFDTVDDNGSMFSAFVRIPLYKVKASAGHGAYVDTEEQSDALIFKKEWIHNELHSNPANLYLIYVEGESMEPTLRPGDVILIDHTDTQGKRDGIYVIRMGDSLLVKRLQRLPNQVLKISSDNPAYDSFEISVSDDLSDEFSVIGRVVWSGRRH